jgi:hypothetical protein
MICGVILHSIAYGSAIEQHLQGIAPSSIKAAGVKVEEMAKEKKEDEDDDDEEDAELLSVRPYTQVGLRRLPEWESYRNWLMLIVSRFEAMYAVSRSTLVPRSPWMF